MPVSPRVISSDWLLQTTADRMGHLQNFLGSRINEPETSTGSAAERARTKLAMGMFVDAFKFQRKGFTELADNLGRMADALVGNEQRSASATALRTLSEASATVQDETDTRPLMDRLDSVTQPALGAIEALRRDLSFVHDLPAVDRDEDREYFQEGFLYFSAALRQQLQGFDFESDRRPVVDLETRRL